MATVGAFTFLLTGQGFLDDTSVMLSLCDYGVTCTITSEAVVFPDLRSAFPLVRCRGGDPVGVAACRAAAAREAVDAVGGWSVGTA
ncbi:hypothetical protein O1Q96_15980 [Streptomyces sp. Qhu-G9]|uniref:hypothetical protein n=1 Tax=Streptomyces sp. Qhu-G9 TaxID=3452799 RepID=UPI0022AC79FA|nr:hypothetical protein [Streptomyces aurantiacus]WAU81143.1 hypothetical protein O1Q96_15980 [Streptomyces aurantiacus]